MRTINDLEKGELIYVSLPNTTGYIIAEFQTVLSEDQCLICYDRFNYSKGCTSKKFETLLNTNVIINEEKIKCIKEHFEIKNQITKLEKELEVLREKDYALSNLSSWV